MAEELLRPDYRMVFIRLSINAVTPAVARRFSSAHAEDVAAQLRGLSSLFENRKKLYPFYAEAQQRVPAIQVSIIIDENNVDDLSSVCLAVSAIAGKYGGARTKDDDVIVRPLTKHRACYSFHDHGHIIIQKILDVCGQNGSVRRHVIDAGLNLHLGFGLGEVDRGDFRSYADVIEDEYKRRDVCWANGIFLTVAPDGTAHICVDRNCYKEWAIGNLLEQSVQEIYAGSRRSQLLERIHKNRCGPEVCEATCRTPRLNRIARMIRSRELTDEDIQEIRERTMDDPPLLLS